MSLVANIKSALTKLKNAVHFISNNDSRHEEDTKTEKIEPLVFVNRPIKNAKDDIIGFSTQVDTICEAIKNDSTMIGVIADYGTGKSSITELLMSQIKAKPLKYPEPIRVNLWDCLQNKAVQNTDRTMEREVSDLTKSFLYQLASGRGKKRRYGSYINKRLSKNYGNISFSTGSFKFWWRFLFAAVFYTIYAVCSNESIKFGKIFPQGWFLDLLKYCRTFSPAFLVIAILFVLWGIIDTCVVFSHWKMQSTRETEINDVFDVYSHIIDHIKPRRKKKQVIIVEDLDRIVEKSIIIGFLKELYRFQNSMREDADKFVFIVSIKPEANLQNDKLTLIIDDKNVYSKLFDVIIPLKPIHYDDYDSVLLALINSDKKNKLRLEKMIGKQIEGDVLPEAFYWIKKGQNLTLRDLKDRLNHAIMILISRKSYSVRSSAEFKACAAVTYLESEYPECYQALIQNEEAFARLMSSSVDIINQNDEIQALELLNEEFKTHFPNISGMRDEFVVDLCQLICEGVFNYDFRMYFYTYPSGSHIKTTEERQLCDMLLLPSKFDDYGEIDKITEMVFEDGDENIVTKTIKGLEKYPQVVLLNITLLRVSCEIDWNKVASAVNFYIIEPMTLDDFAIEFWKRVHDIRFKDKPAFIGKLIKYLTASFSNPEDASLTRGYIINAYGKDILEFRDIFFKKNNSKIPQISEKEIALINDIDTSIELIDLENLSKENFSYIAPLICGEKLKEDSFKKAVDILKKYAELEPIGIQETAIKFMHINQYRDDSLFHMACANAKEEAITDYINLFDPESLSNGYIDDIEESGIDNGFSPNILLGLAARKRYRCILLTASRSNDFSLLDTGIEEAKKIIKDCEWINQRWPGYIHVIRWHFCIEKHDSRYFELFFCPYSLITSTEFIAFSNTSTAINCIDIDSIDEDNYLDLLKCIAQGIYEDTEIILLVKHLFDPDQYSDSIISNEKLFCDMVEGINWLAINVKKLRIDDREALYSLIEAGFDINKTSLEDRQRQLGCLIPSLEEQLSKQNRDSYLKLIQDFDEFTPFTLQWMKEHYIGVPLSKKLSETLKDNNGFENYITSTVLRENNMIIDDSIPFENYLKVYLHVSEMYKIMSDHWVFLERLQKKEYLKQLLASNRSDKLIPPIYKVPQHSDFFNFILSDRFKKIVKTTYLDSIGRFASVQDSKAFQELICKSENMELMGDKERYWKIWNNFWNTSHKRVFTRKWNERWGNVIDINS